MNRKEIRDMQLMAGAIWSSLLCKLLCLQMITGLKVHRSFPCPWRFLGWLWRRQKVITGNIVFRLEDSLSPNLSGDSEGRRKDDTSPGENVATQNKLQGQKGHGGFSWTKRIISPYSSVSLHFGARWKNTQGDGNRLSTSLQDLTSVGVEPESGLRKKDGISPEGNEALQTELQGCEVEVTLDPATAHPRLVLSEDRKSAERGDTRQDLPDNPERFNISSSVLGSEGFTSGRHYWEVEVELGGGWAVGVARDSVRRKGKIQLKPHFGIWALIAFNVPQVPRKVGVYLDYEGGEVRFYNAETMALISSLTATFTGRLVPFFHLWTTGSRLSLSPSQR